MLKAQLAQALQLPRDTRAEQGMSLLRDLDADAGEAASDAPAGTASTSSTASADRTCDRLIAMLRARLAAR